MKARRSQPTWVGCTALLALLAPLMALRAADPLAIRHRAVDCVVADRYPTSSACFDPPERLARARNTSTSAYRTVSVALITVSLCL